MYVGIVPPPPPSCLRHTSYDWQEFNIALTTTDISLSMFPLFGELALKHAQLNSEH